VRTMLSVVIPARNENGCVTSTLESIGTTLAANGISYEIVIVDDGSNDGTAESVRRVAAHDDRIRLVTNDGRHGYGLAVRAGVEHCTGDAIAVMMADGSDTADDLVKYFNKLNEGFDCVFGSRFIKGSHVVDYPFPKLLLNRLANLFIQLLFRIRYNDVTNAFKCYRREVVDGMMPLISPHFNLTVEMPLKAIVRGYNYAVVPISWSNRKTGVSKLRIKEMGSRYLFIVLYMWFEKHLARGDYHRQLNAPTSASPKAPNA
jgi:dolichol-phosphate mannosyltransferase